MSGAARAGDTFVVGERSIVALEDEAVQIRLRYPNWRESRSGRHWERSIGVGKLE